MTLTENIVDRIVASTRKSLAERTHQVPHSVIKDLARKAGLPRDFAGALKGPGINVIAEIKRASPSKGWINETLDPAKQALSYEAGGAAAISVLTEPVFFHGSFADLEQARDAVDLPALCKDFILSPYQIYEARFHRADAILLIASILDGAGLRELSEVARSLGMATLVETHNREEVEKAIAAGVRLFGINNRNLTDFSIDLETTVTLRRLIPSWARVVSESGIKSRVDVQKLEAAGANGILVGESLVTSADPAAQIRLLRGLP
ncbi:MAG: indole-3-glycerol phosphate synthase TrpC [Dehalococcoidia bacterium]|nr:indole-3-glycerol phosphate synthase TrpC [Dehalococcoidia bacterium]